ncbi:hypothetical protein BDW62DRAFT_179365 [Aspergillus aurantiobrunneus]
MDNFTSRQCSHGNFTNKAWEATQNSPLQAPEDYNIQRDTMSIDDQPLPLHPFDICYPRSSQKYTSPSTLQAPARNLTR